LESNKSVFFGKRLLGCGLACRVYTQTSYSRIYGRSK